MVMARDCFEEDILDGYLVTLDFELQSYLKQCLVLINVLV